MKKKKTNKRKTVKNMKSDIGFTNNKNNCEHDNCKGVKNCK